MSDLDNNNNDLNGDGNKPFYVSKKKKLSKKKIAIAFSIMLLLIVLVIVFITLQINKPSNPQNSEDGFGKNFPIKKDPDKVNIFLSAAAHEPDNPCSFSDQCGESIHANEYIDYLEEMLVRCGFNIKRNPKENVGKEALKLTVQTANDWGTDLYYVAHTNAFDEKTAYSLIMTDCAESMMWANILKKRREEIFTEKIIIRTNTELIECYQSDAPTVYDEVVFHDNLEQVTWFHENMKMIAENTARGICDMFVVKFVSE